MVVDLVAPEADGDGDVLLLLYLVGRYSCEKEFDPLFKAFLGV